MALTMCRYSRVFCHQMVDEKRKGKCWNPYDFIPLHFIYTAYVVEKKTWGGGRMKFCHDWQTLFGDHLGKYFRKNDTLVDIFIVLCEQNRYENFVFLQITPQKFIPILCINPSKVSSSYHEEKSPPNFPALIEWGEL